MIEPLPDILIEPVVCAALAEDLGRAGDITSAACIAPEARLLARFAGRRFGVVSGLACARLIPARLRSPHRLRRISRTQRCSSCAGR